MTDPELLAAIKRYREAHFAYWTDQMRRNREYERARQAPGFDEHDAFESNAASMRLYREMGDAQLALVDSPPEDFVALQREMEEEFGG